MACQILDWAIQAHGGGGVSDDFFLAKAYAQARTLRLATARTRSTAPARQARAGEALTTTRRRP
jgi:alkylation response protein AidB-like acyl-CoA dehydrogenase